MDANLAKKVQFSQDSISRLAEYIATDAPASLMLRELSLLMGHLHTMTRHALESRTDHQTADMIAELGKQAADDPVPPVPKGQ